MQKQSPKSLFQFEIPGAQISAVQLAAAREAQGQGRMKARVEQRDMAGGLFAPAPAPDLFNQAERSS